jgi:hypothetical protein
LYQIAVPVLDINIKFSDTKQANEIYQYKNIKRKLYKTGTAIWYNKICRLPDAADAAALCSWGWVVVTPETCRAVVRLNKKLCDLCI